MLVSLTDYREAKERESLRSMLVRIAQIIIDEEREDYSMGKVVQFQCKAQRDAEQRALEFERVYQNIDAMNKAYREELGGDSLEAGKKRIRKDYLKDTGIILEADPKF